MIITFKNQGLLILNGDKRKKVYPNIVFDRQSLWGMELPNNLYLLLIYEPISEKSSHVLSLIC